jgi:arginyl-tRNA synthetase
MNFCCITELESHLRESFKAEHPLDICIERPPPDMTGDITVNCFRLAKPLRRSPMDIAGEVAAFLDAHPDTAAVEQIKAFVNVSLTDAALFRDTVADADGLLADAQVPAETRRRILIEFSAPNTNKPQHLGHVRNNTLGQAMVSILRRAGHQVVPVNLVNDRGIHICKSMLAYQRFGNGETPESSGKKGDHLVGDYYVKYDTELRRQLAKLRDENPEMNDQSDEDLFLKTEIGRAAQDMLVAWEQSDPDVVKLWKTMNEWVFEGFDETYRRLGVEFDKVFLESQTYTLGKDIVQDGLDRGVFKRRDDGAVVIDLAKEKLDTKVVLRSDGTSVYVTQDIGTTILKQNEFTPDQQVWVVGDEQIYHFKVLFAILKELGYEWADNLVHMAYGMVNLPSGKMKSREGTVVDADDLLDEMERLARDATLERSEEPPDDIDERSRVIGLAALKFMLLKVNPKTTLMFDPQASIKFEGDTGPYVLYAYARIASMLRKAEPDDLDGVVDWGALGTPEEKDLALACAAYGETLRKAAEDFDTAGLAGYLLDLAKAFSRFYRDCPVLTAETPELKRARLELSIRARDILRDGLNTLTIETLESM